jgi:serine/threonine protein phosphatase PrpC
MKRRATYPKELRAAAKAKGHGLLTISLEQANGELVEEQITVDIKSAHFAKWAMVILCCDEVREKPNLERVVRGLMNQ